MSELFKTVAYGCWSNERCISVHGQAGILHGRLFTKLEDARRYYKHPYNAAEDDPIVRVTVEIVK